MTMRIEALIFDMDGTIIDNEPYYEQAWARFFAAHGRPMDAKAFNKSTAGMTFADIFARLLPDMQADIPAHVQEIEGYYAEHLRGNLRPAPGFMRLLEEAERLGVPMAIASSALIENVDMVVDGLQIRNRFAAILCPCLGYPGKPAPDLFLAAAEAMNVPAAAALVFEDALAGVEAARRAGMKTVVLTTSFAPEAFSTFDNIVHVMPDFSAFTLEGWT